jgi:hypothetical protein
MTLASIQGSAAGAPDAAGSQDAADGGSIPTQVLEDRKYAIDSAVVRVMKARKMMSHNDLIAEVSRQLTGRFSANPQVFIFLLRIKLIGIFLI